MSYREFYLTNSEGDSWTFTNKSVKSFLQDPSNLGLKDTISVIRYGEKLNVSSEEYDLPTPSGDVLFYDSKNSDRYTKYYNFCRFISHPPLVLNYTLPFSTPVTYTLDCYVTSLSKSESTEDKTMTCTINFQGLSFWKAPEITLTGTGTTYTITNSGDFPVGFEITVEGSLTNPYVTLEQDGELYGEAKFLDSTAFSKVYINSKDGEQEVSLEQGGSVLPNPLSYQDLSISNGSIYVTFVKLARGETTLFVGYDSGSITKVEVKYVPQFRSV